MSEQAPAVQNKGMLVVALVLGVAVVLVYNWQIATVKSEATGKMVKVLCFTHEMRPGEKINFSKDLEEYEISDKFAGRLGDVAILHAPGDKAELANGSNILQRRVNKGDLFAISMVVENRNQLPSLKIKDPKNVAMVVALRENLGKMLWPGDRVNLVGMVPQKNGGVRPDRIMKDVFVLAVGGQGLQRDTSMSPIGDEGMTSYKTIVVELSEDAALELRQVLAYVGGSVDVELVPPLADKSPFAGKVREGLVQELRSMPPSPRAGG